jgi:hypothetical protein
MGLPADKHPKASCGGTKERETRRRGASFGQAAAVMKETCSKREAVPVDYNPAAGLGQEKSIGGLERPLLTIIATQPPALHASHR